MSRSGRDGRRRPWAANFGTPGEWFAALGGMAAYALHLVVGFWIVPTACRLGTTLPIHATTAVLGGMALASTVVAWRSWRRQARAIRAEAAAGEGGGGGLLSLPYLLLLVRGRTRAAERLVTTAGAARAAAGTSQAVDPTERRSAFLALFGTVAGVWAVLTILYAESFAWFLDPCV